MQSIWPEAPCGTRFFATSAPGGRLCADDLLHQRDGMADLLPFGFGITREWGEALCDAGEIVIGQRRGDSVVGAEAVGDFDVADIDGAGEAAVEFLVVMRCATDAVQRDEAQQQAMDERSEPSAHRSSPSIQVRAR
jgi:hypothetical protein